MIFIPGSVVALATCPGIILHEFAHLFFCRLTGTRVIDVVYFNFDDAGGEVLHEVPVPGWKQIIISGGPFLINTLTGFFFGILTQMFVVIFPGWEILYYFTGWLAVTIGMHAFPSLSDAASAWSGLMHSGCSLLVRILGLPFAAMLWFGSLLSVVMLHITYGLVLGYLMPLKLSRLLFEHAG